MALAHEMDDRGIVSRIQALGGQLTGTEQLLVARLLAAPREISLGTSADFAQRAGAHEATTSRFVRKLGFRNYAAFRDALRAEFLHGAEPAERMSATLQISGGNLLDGLIGQEIAALSAILDHIDQTRIARAAELIDRPRQFIFAHGNATALAVMVERRLRRMGFLPVLLTGGPRDLAEQAVGIGAGDAVILFAFRRQPRSYATLLHVAREQGAATLAISDAIGPALSPAPDLLLAAPRAGDDDSFQTLNVPMLLCNALILALGNRRQPDGLSALTRLGELIRRFDLRDE
ncbi:MurR/RpiR family transcriptional regulator [Paracoccus laeviglucosivorans]|uniref:Transcriptional regulator, RpiR family n=1 Tax=Paracoccus laeviglucosivorans TaxID=1197861 RepID=A0A521BAI4_9RHOB|nr:MurR/RpiR family transcriptional regulator [Paracoccus laeviglucosivorans]SMO44083.1 transcriptional regulator, RpiR family [Paracoccus laeviglucosivorans]